MSCDLDEKIALLGAIQSLFEGSMYTFVFLWTPALSPNNEDIPHGFIFATLMMGSMLGSSIASRLLAHNSPKVESYMQIVFMIGSASLLLPIITSVCHTSYLVYVLVVFLACCLNDSSLFAVLGNSFRSKGWRHLIFWLPSTYRVLYL